MMDDGDGGALGCGDGPAAAQEIDLVVGVDPAAQMQCQMQVQRGGGRARPDGDSMEYGQCVGFALGDGELLTQSHFSSGFCKNVG